jgi:hypothetical protein
LSGIKQTEAELTRLTDINRRFGNLPDAAARYAASGQVFNPATGTLFNARVRPPPEEEDESGGGGRLGGALGRRLALRLAGAAAIGATLGVFQQLFEAQAKLTKELEEEGAKLIDLAKSWHEAAESATTANDVTKIASSGLAAIEAATRKANEANMESLPVMEQMLQNLAKIGSFPFKAPTPFSDLQKSRTDALYVDVEATRQALRGATEEAKHMQDAFDARKLKTASDAIGDITSHINELKEQQKHLVDDKGRIENIESYAKLGEKVKAYENQLKAIVALDKERGAVLDANLPKEQQEANQYIRLVEALRALGINAKTAQEAFKAGVGIGGERGALIENIATQLSKLTPAGVGGVGGVFPGQTGLTPSQQAAAMEQSRKNADERTLEFYSDQQYATDSYYAHQKDAYAATSENTAKVEKERAEELQRRREYRGQQGEGSIQSQMLTELQKMNTGWGF